MSPHNFVNKLTFRSNMQPTSWPSTRHQCFPIRLDLSTNLYGVKSVNKMWTRSVSIEFWRHVLWQRERYKRILFERKSSSGIKNPVRTSQEAHYFSTTEPSQLKLCNIEGFTAGTTKDVVFTILNPSSNFTGDTLRLRYRAQPVNATLDLRFTRRSLWRMSSSGI
jgi:hypothetical protein